MKRRHGSTFLKRLVRTYPYGTDPAKPGILGTPPPLVNTARFGVITGEGGQFHNGYLAVDHAGFALASGTFTVDDNDFTTGIALLVLGEYKLISNVDYTPGISTDATATAIGAAINRLPGFSATVDTSDVTVFWDGPIDEVEFYAVHYGTVTNFIDFAPSTGFLTMGSPAISAPLLTV